ncbi:MAG TPA: hypothetical protein VFT69_09340 [Pseudolabrys sp.]|nr:hypothetical protein [Pseudolabrys sp.]
MRIIDISKPSAPHEVVHFIPDHVGGRPAPQINDVMIDERRLIIIVDPHVGFDVLEFGG